MFLRPIVEISLVSSVISLLVEKMFPLKPSIKTVNWASVILVASGVKLTDEKEVRMSLKLTT